MSQSIPTFDPQVQRPITPSHLEVVVNAVDVTVRFTIDGHPGSPPVPFELAPGAQAMLPRAYCLPIEGSNPQHPRESVLWMKTAMSPYPDAPQIQTVVPLGAAAATARAWAAAKHAEPRSQTVLLTDTKGKSIPIEIPRVAAAARASQPAVDDDDEPEIEAPPPGEVDLRPSPPPAAEAPPAIKTVTAPVPEQPKPKARG